MTTLYLLPQVRSATSFAPFFVWLACSALAMAIALTLDAYAYGMALRVMRHCAIVAGLTAFTLFLVGTPKAANGQAVLFALVCIVSPGFLIWRPSSWIAQKEENPEKPQYYTLDQMTAVNDDDQYSRTAQLIAQAVKDAMENQNE